MALGRDMGRDSGDGVVRDSVVAGMEVGGWVVM